MEELNNNNNNNQTNTENKVSEEKEKVVHEQFSKEDIENNKVIASVAYLIFFLPFLTAKESKYAMYHAYQATVLFIVYLLGYLVLQFLWGILPYSMFGFIYTLQEIWGVVALVFVVIGALNAYNGKAVELPIIGQYSKYLKK